MLLHSKTAANIFSGYYIVLSCTSTNISVFKGDVVYLYYYIETYPIFTSWVKVITTCQIKDNSINST